MTQRDPLEVVEVKERATSRILALPGVHAIGVGNKQTRGELTGETSILVFVERKRPLDEIPVEERVPAEIDGVKTDVIEEPVPVIMPVPPGQLFGVSRKDLHEYRPIRGGTQIARAHGSGAGTLGCMFTVRNDPNTIIAVTNHHVIYSTCGTAANHEEVGQPAGSTSSSACCSDIIGTVLDAQCDPDVDIALVKLSPGLQYMAEVHEVGRVTATHLLTAAEVAGGTFLVKKRGRTSGLTGGTLQAGFRTGVIRNHDGTVHRTYQGVLSVRANPDPTNPGTPTDFSLPGDSGSAVLNESDAVVGILFGGSPAVNTATTQTFGTGLFIPIKTITDKFAEGIPAPRRIELAVARADNAGEVRTVPTLMVAADPTALPMPVISPGEAARIEAEIRTTESGRWYAELYDRHRAEVSALVRENRRVTIVWHRSGAAELLQWLMRAFTRNDVRLPGEIQGRPLRACLEDIGQALARYGSSALRADVERLLPVIPDVSGLDGPEILAGLRASDPRVAPAPA